MTTATEISIVVIGAGAWGKRLALTASRLQGVNLQGIVSEKLASGARERFLDTPVWPTVDAMLQETEPDGVLIATPPTGFGKLIPNFFEKRIAVFAEKPLSESSETARSLVRAAHRTNTLLMVDFIYLFHNAIISLKKAFDEATPPLHIESYGGNRGPLRDTIPAYWDYGPHDLSLALSLLGTNGNPIAVEKIKGDNWEHVLRLSLSWPNGSDAVLEFGNRFEQRVRRLTVKSALRTAEFEDGASEPLTIDGHPVALEGTPPMDNAILTFADAIRNGKTRHKSQEIAVRVNEILEWVGTEMDGKW